jgi:hypothetical protein
MDAFVWVFVPQGEATLNTRGRRLGGLVRGRSGSFIRSSSQSDRGAAMLL